MATVTVDPVQAAIAFASAVAALLFARRQIGQMKRQLTVADQYYQIYRKQRAFYRAVFQFRNNMDDQQASDPPLSNPIFGQSSGAEMSLMFEAFGEVTYQPNYVFVLANVPERQGDYAINILFHYNQTPTALSRRHGRMQLKPDRYVVNDLQLSVISANVDSINYLYRFEEYRTIVENERKFEHEMNAIQFALRRQVAVNSGLSMSMDKLGSSRTQLADFYGKMSNTFAGAAGYMTARERVVTPRIGTSMRGDYLDDRPGTLYPDAMSTQATANLA